MLVGIQRGSSQPLSANRRALDQERGVLAALIAVIVERVLRRPRAHLQWRVILSAELRFPVSEIIRWASRYSYPRSDHDLIEKLRPAAQLQRHLTRDQLLRICRWKSPRSAPKAEINDERY